ncbi:LysR family transcriptional regulator [Marivibrio halodurans]|uniref:LysR family transcriptional regulator n=1 Tax=Marivibrio halodurans TaxID=2039722 RepID=A0A8J7V1E8_9PROT|nr:LysR family transcriptional regulator [Marivibrio halodurans]MBP5856016.1 LysR family transcriptional regulator [Marivibrio halodurans]
MDRSMEMAVFAKVVEEGSFSSAARNLKLTPSAVSKQIARLEDRLGVRLLNRTTRRLSATEEGAAFYQRAARILSDIDEAEAAVTQLHAAPRGTLRINCGIAFGKHQITPLMPEFLARYPELRIELTLTDSVSDLVEEGQDVAVRFGPLQDSSMVARQLAVSRRAIVAAPSYFEAHGTPRHPSELTGHNCLTFSNMPHLNEWIFKIAEGEEYRVKAEGNFTASNGETIHEMVLAGLGVARLAEFLVEPEVQEGKLQRVLQPFYRDIEVPINAVYPTRRHLSPKVRAFVDFLIEKFQPVPPWARG